MITLAGLARSLSAELLACWPSGAGATVADTAVADTAVADISHDSRRITAGAVFACLPGAVTDGHRFVSEAVAAGAVGLLAQEARQAASAGVPCLMVPSVREALGPAAALVHGSPSQRLDLVGVTGTNGKTTTVRLTAELLRAAGRDPVEIGTLTGALTTPEATDLQRALAAGVARGASEAVVEVSSHALAQQRVDGCRFKVAAFTNLSRDHLDFHGSMEQYFAAKARLFTDGLADSAVVDVTGPWGRRLADEISSRGLMPLTTFSLDDVEVLASDASSSTFRWRGQKVLLPLAGAFNRANAVLAAELALHSGLTPAETAEHLAAARPVAGRFEPVDAGDGQDFRVIVDYAHTPDALSVALRTARSLTEGRLIVVFGAGGERDRGKRREMGAAAERLADLVCITSDNPRSEDPREIIDEIAAGMSREPERREPDRRLALRHCLSAARRGDTVLVAGKGHEPYQVIDERVLAFDDRDVLRQELARLARSRQPRTAEAGR
ncbi:MAG: UDP-N-acetylmuramoyl-L-alanyl-D-glutamate--2,6-diaminopimelate ligase [Acidimicrobiaceae bacterium]|nr:UDP-N-acetylmuramoyl-L-alanyl-D-glutamate--2,6-diaminopimelate ligase [Acidimicrobiaceae bacterium]MCY4279956.1 UDP-N-acetylmuramoyl-L-alanyl-D-glutamate--2,6-diaminopimelate ligase [Acidimicrobiaceae bacterium]MCY4294577.1 UDP-N-acetylmuramoyl-L-alanyl-D-glutamate--2,6-diaminopimelate ligase [Acidimicrobiaceae bacterium]